MWGVTDKFVHKSWSLVYQKEKFFWSLSKGKTVSKLYCLKTIKNYFHFSFQFVQLRSLLLILTFSRALLYKQENRVICVKKESTGILKVFLPLILIFFYVCLTRKPGWAGSVYKWYPAEYSTEVISASNFKDCSSATCVQCKPFHTRDTVNNGQGKGFGDSRYFSLLFAMGAKMDKFNYFQILLFGES